MRSVYIVCLIILSCLSMPTYARTYTQDEVRILKDYARELLTANHYFASAIAYKYAIQAMQSTAVEDWLKQQILEGSKRAAQMSKQPEPDLDDVRPELSAVLDRYLSANQLSSARSLPFYSCNSAQFRLELAERCKKLGLNQQAQSLLAKASKKSPTIAAAPGTTVTYQTRFEQQRARAMAQLQIPSPTPERQETPEHMLQNAEAAVAGKDLNLAQDLFERVNQALYRHAPSDPLRARALNGLIALSYNTGKLDDAAAYFEQLLPILEDNYGSQDKDLGRSFRNYAGLLRRLNKNAKADVFEQQAALIDKGKSGTCRGLVSALPPTPRTVAQLKAERDAEFYRRKARNPRWGIMSSDFAALHPTLGPQITGERNEAVINQDFDTPIARSITTTQPTYTAADMRKAYDAYDKGDYDEALKAIAPLADADVVDAQMLLAEMYLNGKGVAKDPARAFLWFNKAANLGNTDAQNAAGYLCAKGLGTTKDPKAAVSWFSMAANGGNMIAKYNLGHAYATGIGCGKSDDKSKELLTQSAAVGADGKDFVLGDANLRGRFHVIPKELARTERIVIIPTSWRADRFYGVTGFDTYAQRLVERIGNRIRLDLQAPNAVIASFEVAPDGACCKLLVSRSSGDKSKDDLVLTRIKSAGPFRPLPIGSAGPVFVQIRVGAP